MANPTLDVPELPFPVTTSHPGVWRRDEQDGRVVADAPGHTDIFVNPEGQGSDVAEPILNAPTLLGVPPEGDFQLSARVTVDFRAKFDAGVLLVWIDEAHWAKFCFEFSPAAEPTVVTVVNRGLSDDANAFTIPERTVWLRIARIGRAYAFHASTDGAAWQLIRVFNLGDAVSDHQVGLEAQSPTGDGCTVTFDQIQFTRQRLEDLRDGS